MEGSVKLRFPLNESAQAALTDVSDEADQTPDVWIRKAIRRVMNAKPFPQAKSLAEQVNQLRFEGKAEVGSKTLLPSDLKPFPLEPAPEPDGGTIEVSFGPHLKEQVERTASYSEAYQRVINGYTPRWKSAREWAYLSVLDELDTAATALETVDTDDEERELSGPKKDTPPARGVEAA